MADIKFIDNTAQVLKEMKKKKETALEIIGAKAESYAKMLCPVLTGRLRNSISHAQLNEDTEVIGTNVHYAPYVEMGTRRQRAKPYLRPAAENHSAEYRSIIERVMKE